MLDETESIRLYIANKQAMQCWNCGKPVRQEAKLCVYCGTKLAQDDMPRDLASDERGRGARQFPSGGHGSHSARDERDVNTGYEGRDRSGRGVGGQSREYEGDRGQSQGGSRSAGPRLPFTGGGRRLIDPLDDPRAPRGLRKSQPISRQEQPRHGSYGSSGSHGADNGSGRHAGGGGYEHEGQRYNNGDPGYDARYDPDSAEYDAVADRRRRGERASANGHDDYGRDGYNRRSGGQRDDRYDGVREQQRGGRGDEPRDRRSVSQQPRSGYGNDNADPRAGYSEEYPSRYRDAPSAEYSAEYPAPYDDAPSAEYSAEYSAEMDAHGSYPRDQGGYRGGGYDESASWDAYPARGRAASHYAPEDSWNLPAVSETQLPAAGWTGDWHSAQPVSAREMSDRSGRGSGRGTSMRSTKRAHGSGIVAVVIGIVALVAVAAVIIGVSQRAAILSRLPGATHTNTHPFATYTPGPTPTVVPHYKQFSSDSALYVVNYPEQWAEQTSNQPNTGYDYVDTFTGQNPYAAFIVEQAAAFANISDADIVTAEVNGGKQAGRTFTETQAASGTVNAGGEQWTRREFDVSDGNTKLHMAILTCHHSGRGYAIVLVATPDTFAKDDTAVFQTVLNSFRFAS